MNERIQEFAKHHLVRDEHTEFGWRECHKYEFDPDELEKFAELIIKEAIDVVNKRYMGDNNREDMEVRRCVEDLKKHFGVE